MRKFQTSYRYIINNNYKQPLLDYYYHVNLIFTPQLQDECFLRVF